MVGRVRLTAVLLLLGLASVGSQVEVVDDVSNVRHTIAISTTPRCWSRLRLAIIYQDVASAVALAGGLTVFLHLHLRH